MTTAESPGPEQQQGPPDPITQGLRGVLDQVAPQTSGAVADYIPELAVAEPEQFGIALVSLDGHAYGVGDCLVPFTIQSISKAFVFALALSDHGMEAVLERVGVEPSGDAFNAISLERETGRPANPMVNAGALLTTSLVKAQYPEERLERIRRSLSDFAGRRLEVDEAVAQSELATASRNRALAYLMESAGSLEEPVEEVLEVYCRQCAISVTARDLAMMAATLANGGVHPVTEEAVVSEDVAVRTLAVMATCGMYDFSGEWLMRVGLPAKSGVGGGVIAVSPGEFGIGVFSPRLDERGNSVRGIAVARALADNFNLNLMRYPGETAPVVYHAEHLPTADGRSVASISGQGVLAFGAAESLLFAVHDLVTGAPGGAAGVLLDLHRVTSVQEIAEQLMRNASGALLAKGIPLAIVRQEHLLGPLLQGEGAAAFETREAALAWLQSKG